MPSRRGTSFRQQPRTDASMIAVPSDYSTLSYTLLRSPPPAWRPPSIPAILASAPRSPSKNDTCGAGWIDSTTCCSTSPDRGDTVYVDCLSAREHPSVASPAPHVHVPLVLQPAQPRPPAHERAHPDLPPPPPRRRHVQPAQRDVQLAVECAERVPHERRRRVVQREACRAVSAAAPRACQRIHSPSTCSVLGSGSASAVGGV